jgi:hypothetical protein
MTVPGDQWPIFLYAGYEYDAEDPWKGLFKSNILVCVSFVVTVASCEQLINCFVRLINTYLRLQVPSKRDSKLRDQVMHESTA